MPELGKMGRGEEFISDHRLPPRLQWLCRGRVGSGGWGCRRRAGISRVLTKALRSFGGGGLSDVSVFPSPFYKNRPAKIPVHPNLWKDDMGQSLPLNWKQTSSIGHQILENPSPPPPFLKHPSLAFEHPPDLSSSQLLFQEAPFQCPLRGSGWGGGWGVGPPCGGGGWGGQPPACGPRSTRCPAPGERGGSGLLRKGPRSPWPSAHAPVPTPAVGACVARSPPSPHPRPTESRTHAILRPRLATFSLSTLSALHPAPFQACPGPQQQKPHHLYPHILHAGRADVPTSVLRAEVVGGVGGGAGAEGGEKRDPAERRARNRASPGRRMARTLPRAAMGEYLAFALEGRRAAGLWGAGPARRPASPAVCGVGSWLLPVGGGRGTRGAGRAGRRRRGWGVWRLSSRQCLGRRNT